MGRFEWACIKLIMPGESARTLFLCKMDLEWGRAKGSATELFFLEVARTLRRHRATPSVHPVELIDRSVAHGSH
jgi:hypothetical protein